MKNLLLSGIVLLTSLALTNCASNYKSINPNIITYASKSTSASSDLLLEYKYDVLYKKYKKKETKHGLRLVAVKITNLSDKDLVLGKDLNLIQENQKPFNLLDSKEIYNEIKQIQGAYLLYLLLTPLRFYVTKDKNGFQDSNSVPIGYVIGPGLAIGNMVKASSSNRLFRNELKKFNLKDQTIKKGETTYGLIGIRSRNYDALNLYHN